MAREEKAVSEAGQRLVPEAVPGLPASDLVEADTEAQVRGGRDGQVSIFVCPECGGSMWQANAGTLVRFRCHVGHVLSGEDLLEEQAAALERSLWYAARALRDKANLGRQLANEARQRGVGSLATRYEEKAQTDDHHADVIEQMIASGESVSHAE